MEYSILYGCKRFWLSNNGPNKSSVGKDRKGLKGSGKDTVPYSRMFIIETFNK
jgi:hypothetical protein